MTFAISGSEDTKLLEKKPEFRDSKLFDAAAMPTLTRFRLWTRGVAISHTHRVMSPTLLPDIAPVDLGAQSARRYWHIGDETKNGLCITAVILLSESHPIEICFENKKRVGMRLTKQMNSVVTSKRTVSFAVEDNLISHSSSAIQVTMNIMSKHKKGRRKDNE
jgi:hypothetical protein